MNKIKVRILSNTGDGKPATAEIPEGTTCRQIADHLKLSTSENVVRVNNTNVGWDYAPPADAKISFAPLKAGGTH